MECPNSTAAATNVITFRFGDNSDSESVELRKQQNMDSSNINEEQASKKPQEALPLFVIFHYKTALPEMKH